MINKILGAVFAITLVLTLTPNLAQAADGSNTMSAQARDYRCKLSGHMHGESVAIVFGGELIHGRGVLRCVNVNTGRRFRIPVYLKMVGGGVGFDFAVIRSLRIRSASIMVDSPRRFFDTFSLGAAAGATLINEGIAFDTALEVNSPRGFGFEVGLQGENAVGLGAYLYALAFMIQRI